MKIKKILTENINKLYEDADEDVEMTPIDTSDSAEEIGEVIADQISDLSDEEIQIDAAKTGELVDRAADSIDADTAIIEPAGIASETPESRLDALVLENEITKVLDEALQSEGDLRRRHSPDHHNVLIIGLPGSSKTASVKNWAKRATLNGKPVHLVELDAKNQDLNAYINGYTMADPDKKLTVSQGVSNNLDGLEQENAILFLDELNRQVEQGIRGSLLSLIQEHVIYGKEAGGKHHLKNFLFTVAAINPYIGRADTGATRLNGAEKNRFISVLKHANSNKKDCGVYITAYYDSQVERECAQENPSFEEVISLLQSEYLGMYLMDESSGFKFTDENTYASRILDDVNIVSQRLITAGLETHPSKERFINWVEHYADLADEDIEMIKNALEYFEMPPDQELLDWAENRGVKLGKFAGWRYNAANDETSKSNTEADPGNTESEAESNIEDDDDPQLWTGASTTTSGKTIQSPTEVEDSIKTLLHIWSNQ